MSNLGVRSLIDAVLALPCALLPKRYWQTIDLPIPNVAALSAVITMFLGVALGVRGYFAYLEGLRHIDSISMLSVGQAQVSGALPESSSAAVAPFAVAATAPFAFALFSPIGLFATYVTMTSFLRVVAAYVDESFGDPILTGVDAAVHRLVNDRHAERQREERERLEGSDEPDRLHTGEWADVPEATYVVVAARRKAGWTQGTFVITPDGWFTLGEPFDRPTPRGIRTVYPLLRQTSTSEALRKGVSYELPPLSPAPTRPRRETTRPGGESNTQGSP